MLRVLGIMDGTWWWRGDPEEGFDDEPFMFLEEAPASLPTLHDHCGACADCQDAVPLPTPRLTIVRFG